MQMGFVCDFFIMHSNSQKAFSQNQALFYVVILVLFLVRELSRKSQETAFL